MEYRREERNSAIELLRIIAMIGVVVIHYNSTSMGNALGFVKQNTLNQYYLFASESFSICAVNLFIIISAYFLSQTQKRRMSKVVELIFQLIVFKMVIYLIGAIMHNTFSIGEMILSSLPNKYFVILYCVLYIISPYINIVINKLSFCQFKKLIILCFIIFSVCTIFVDYFCCFFGNDYSALSPIGAEGSQAGHTIVNFSLAYLFGAFIAKNDISLSKRKATLLFFISVTIIFSQSVVEQMINISFVSWNYNNPFVFLAAISLFLLFKSIHVKSNIINEIAKGAFTCYLIHRAFIPFINIDRYANSNVFVLLFHQIGCAIVIYFISYIVYKIYTLCTKWFFRLINPLVNRINISIEI